ncbi:UNVERIFIED_CONTAM: hypothetical protein Sindi_0092500 [Sesamum indicum]
MFVQLLFDIYHHAYTSKVQSRACSRYRVWVEGFTHTTTVLNPFVVQNSIGRCLNLIQMGTCAKAGLQIPRHAFILWLAILGKLPTTDKPWLSHLGPASYVTTEVQKPTLTYSSNADLAGSALQKYAEEFSSNGPIGIGKQTLNGRQKKWRGKHIVNIAYRSLLAACVNHIWRERNLRRFEHTEQTPNTIGMMIIDDVRQRILSINTTLSISTRALYRLWRIPWPVEGETN